MTLPLRALSDDDGVAPRRADTGDALVDSYRSLVEVFHDILSERSLDALLERIADRLEEIVPYDALAIYEADEGRRRLIPVIARDRWAEEMLSEELPFGAGITGWAVEHREAVLANEVHLDPRSRTIPGTPENEPEVLISVPLIARGSVKGALNVYRLGDDVLFTQEEFELAKRFGDAAAVAIDNAQVHKRLELQAQTDSLTGLVNHRLFHERLRSELARANRAQDTVALLMLDIDDFKKVNDVYGHAAGDDVLRRIADLLAGLVRSSDVACRVGGEELAVILPSCTADDAVGLATRFNDALAAIEFDPAGKITVSIGVSEAPRHAMNPRDLVAYAEAAMMTSKARGKGRVVVFDEGATERPEGTSAWHDMRSIAQLKMLQSLAGKLNRLNEVRQIGEAIVNELRLLIDYHNCRVYVVDQEDVIPIAFRGELGEYGEERAELLQCKVGDGIAGTVALTGRSILLENARDCDFALPVAGTPDIDESMIAVPLLFGSHAIGLIVLSKLGTGQFDENDLRLLEVLAGQASVALENARLYEAQRRDAETARESAEIASSLLEFGRGLASAEGTDEVLERVVDFAGRSFGGARTSLWLEDPESGLLRARAFSGYGEQRRAHIAGLSVRAEAARAVMEPERTRVLTDGELAALHVAGPEEGPRIAVAGFRVDERRHGFLVAVVPEGQEVEERTMRLLAGIANQAKLAVANALSFEALEKTLFQTVEALANALEASDAYTSTHARTITDMALDVGRELGLGPDALKRLELGALFHDIGKIGTPSHILAKAGPLTEEERSVVELHPELGEKILSPITLLEDVRPIVRHCHERWDGAGYPDGKVGSAIPIESRIILVCDAFHAMTSDRPYRRRLAAAEASRRLRDGAGTQFDPDVVRTFLPLHGTVG
jgi:diguanylate cyclase (GGDEF)-like protein